MFGKCFWVFLGVLLFAVSHAHAYFLSATDGENLYLFHAVKGSDGKLSVVSEFKYAAPGTMGSTSLLPASATDTTKVFDLFGVFTKDAKPVIFRDRITYDETSRAWTHNNRKLFLTHKVNSYNTISGSFLDNLAANVAAKNERFLLTANGPSVNSRKVNAAGKLTGANKPVFNTPSNFFPFSAAFSPDGGFAIQTGIVTSGFQGLSTLASTRVVSVADRKKKKVAHYTLSEDVHSVTAGESDDRVCAAGRALQGDTARSQSKNGAAAVRGRVIYFNFNKTDLTPGKVTKLTKLKVTNSRQYEVFNTTLLTPDATAIIYSKENSNKLEFVMQPLNGACGPKKGPASTFLARTNPTIANNNPLYGMAAAACAAGLLKGFC